jgi:hypothetical protein
MPPAPRRRRPERGDDRDRGLQVRQVPHGVPAPDHGRRPARLLAGPRRGVPRASGGHVPRQQPRPAAGQPQHPQDVRRARDGSGHQGPSRAAGPAAARPEARHGRSRPCWTGIATAGTSRPGPGPVHLARTHRPRSPLTGISSAVPELLAWPPPGWSPPGRRAAHGIVPTWPPSCGASSPTGWPGRRRPAEHWSPPTATPAGSCSPSPGPRPARRPAPSASPTWTPRSSGSSCSTSKSSGGTEAPPATPAWPRSTPCSSTQPPGLLSTPP